MIEPQAIFKNGSACLSMNRIFLTLVLWRAVELLAAAQTPGVTKWIQWSAVAGGNNHYYALTLSATNWTGPEQQAEAWGGTLATITSSDEQNFINTTFMTGR